MPAAMHLTVLMSLFAVTVCQGKSSFHFFLAAKLLNISLTIYLNGKSPLKMQSYANRELPSMRGTFRQLVCGSLVQLFFLTTQENVLTTGFTRNTEILASVALKVEKNMQPCGNTEAFIFFIF